VIFLGIGANLRSLTHGSPLATCAAAIDVLNGREVTVIRRSRWYASQPLPPSDQPHYINGVLEVQTALAPGALLDVLQDIERVFGRRRSRRNAARTLDLDLLVYDDVVMEDSATLALPHPRMHERAFVLRPLADLAPEWRHPRLGLSTLEMLAAVSPEQVVEALEKELGGDAQAADANRRVLRPLS
jgi:2-amino-4-hydroxy-6-hydroxymethyldihydropteridine diphosphokinase